ncbi:MAG: SusC/RagA family TonB-linked outer membrane protein [Chlorobi bacterium]|nr:SusC/RagA family TonB-linked outer membrane protein [Chlorobiota bacterium]
MKHFYKISKKILPLFIGIFALSFVYAQERTITGTVTSSDDGSTLPGVSVVVKETTVGTITDMNGKYSLQVPEDATILEFSFVGMITEEAEIGDKTVIDMVMVSDIMQLGEIVAVGYGTQKVKEITSAITSIKAENFNQGNINNPTQLIQGKVAGLAITHPGGDPNAANTIRLRGLSTFGANTEPLIIVDGIQGASLNSVDPQDIASMDVLKDASATAIYGTRGASGVILITTKKGVYDKSKGVQKPNISFNTYLTSEKIDRKLDVLTPDEYLSFPNATDFGSRTDWMDEITRKGISNVQNLSIDGASETSSYRISVNHRKGNGVVLKSGFEQLNGRLNFTQKAMKNMLTFNLILASTMRNETYSPGEAITAVAKFNPTAPIMADDDFSKEWGGYFQRQAFAFYNPLAIIEQSTLNGKKKDNTGSFKVDFEPFKGINFNPLKGFKISAFYTQSRNDELYGDYWSKNSYYNPYSLGSHDGFAKKRYVEKTNQLAEFIGNLNKNIGKLNVRFLAGYSYQVDYKDEMWIYGKGFLSDAFLYNSMGTASGTLTTKEATYSYKSVTKLAGMFGRLNLNYNDAIFLTSNIRRDGSSMFGKNNRWGVFPGLSVGTDLTKFIAIPFFDKLKLRGGYGETGNLPRYPYLSQRRFNVSNLQFFYDGEYIQAFEVGQNDNPDLQWEVKKETDIGLDFSMFYYRINGTIDYYKSISSNLIIKKTEVSGANINAETWQNAGGLENSGLELTLNIKAIESNDFTWSTDINFTKYLNTKLENTGDSTFIGELGAPYFTGINTIVVMEGKELGQIWTPVFTGIDSTGTMTVQTYTDTSNIEHVLYKNVGNGLPEFQIGWGNTFNYKNFYCNFFVRGVFGHSLINVNNARYGDPTVIGIQSGMGITEDYKDYTGGTKWSDIYVEKASYLKLDNFSIGYKYELKNTDYIRNVNFYVSGQNLFTITNYSGVDPEVRYGDSNNDNNPLAPGIDRENSYFTTKTITFGVVVGF